MDESALDEPPRQAGFIELEPVSYVAPFEGSETRTSARTRLFYNLIPADTAAKERPVFVLFNGGPGAATSLLRAFGTGPQTLDPDDIAAGLVANAASLTSLGNLLYIDSRHAGFSHGVTASPDLEAERSAAFTGGSFNPAIDAADFVRVLLRVLERNPALRNNPVVLVGESYGGVRAVVMMDYLLEPTRIGTAGDVYQDGALADEILAHARSVFVGVAEADLTPAVLARQFGWQVLIEPLVVGSVQLQRARDMIGAVAAAAGVAPAEVESRSTYDVTRRIAWEREVPGAAHVVAATTDGFTALIGLAPTAVPGLPASERTGAFRTEAGATGLPVQFPELGALPAWDRYYYPFAERGAASGAFVTAFNTPLYSIPFLRDVRRGHTLITNALYDIAIIGASVVPALRELMPMFTTPWYDEVSYVGDDPDTPSESIRIHFLDLSSGEPAADAFIHFPTFAASGHFVTLAEPARFRAVLASFLADTGL